MMRGNSGDSIFGAVGRRGEVAVPKRFDTRLLLFLGRNCLLGILVGWSVLAGLLYFDVAGFGTVLFGAAERWLALAMAAAGFAVTFGSLAMGTAVFLLPKDY